jgi:hypothetical protein
MKSVMAEFVLLSLVAATSIPALADAGTINMPRLSMALVDDVRVVTPHVSTHAVTPRVRRRVVAQPTGQNSNGTLIIDSFANVGDKLSNYQDRISGEAGRHVYSRHVYRGGAVAPKCLACKPWGL